MNRYHIRIDGEQSADSYTYQELVDMGLFELDSENLSGVEVKKATNKVFKPFESFSFPERQSNKSSYYVDEYGQIHRGDAASSSSSSTSPSFPSSSGSTNTSSSGLSSPTPSSSSSNSTSNSDGWDIFWRIIGTILVLAIGIPILINVGEGFWSYVVGAVGYFILKSIWD